MDQFKPLIRTTTGANGIEVAGNNGDLALDAEEIALLRSGIISWSDFVRLSEAETDTLKLTQKTVLEVRARIGRPPLIPTCEQCRQLVE